MTAILIFGLSRRISSKQTPIFLRTLGIRGQMTIVSNVSRLNYIPGQAEKSDLFLLSPILVVKYLTQAFSLFTKLLNLYVQPYFI